jgi:hypothetical protein
MPKKTAPDSESPAPIEFPPYIVNIQRLLAETRQCETGIKVNADSLDELRGDLDRRILSADPTQQSALNALAGPAQHVAILERRAALLGEELDALKTQLGNATAQATDRLRVAAKKHDDRVRDREIEERSAELSADQRADLRHRAKTWGSPSWDSALRLGFTAAEAPEILRLAERIFADLPAVAEAEA